MSVRTGRNCIGALILIVALALAVCGGAAGGAPQSSRWIRFHDPQTGLAFRYPARLQVLRRDPKTFGLPKVETIVDLIGNTRLNPGTIVLRFLVNRGVVSVRERARKEEQLRRACIRTSPLMIDRRKAVVCISADSAAVHWSVEILDPRECTILTLLGGADYAQSLPPPHDGDFPLLSIIRTVHFTSPAAGEH